MKEQNSTNESSPKEQSAENDSFEDVKFLKEQLLQKENLAFVGQMTAGILHEIKNPLSFVNTFSRLSLDLLSELKDIEPKIIETLDQNTTDEFEDITTSLNTNISKILENGQRAERVIISILAQARENKAVEFVPTQINQLVDEFTKLGYQGMRGQDQNFVLSIKTSFDPLLTTVKVDPQDLSRVILNLVNNACYAVNQKKTSLGDNYMPEIAITTKRNENNFMISIRDNGIGMSKQVIERIFNPFFTTKPHNEGTGLGLFISYNIVTNIHKGTLDVDTKEGEYTNFIITIPLHQ